MKENELLFQTIDVIWNVRKLVFDLVSVQEKSQGNFVTSIDLTVEQYLKENLSKLVPGAGFISEESEPCIREDNWVIDPIDGTGNLLFGFPYAVSVAYMHKTENTRFGVIYDYQQDYLYYAVKGGGAYILRRNAEAEPIHASDMEVNGISLFGMPYNRNKTHKILKIVERLFTLSSDIKRVGPASLDICSVASGKAQIYAELDLQRWDIQAGKLILEEAGGVVIKKDDLYLFCANLKTAERVFKLLFVDSNQ